MDRVAGEIMVSMTVANDDLVAWLLEGDPSIRWRVHRDLLGSSESRIRAERDRVATEGWGAKLISLQDPDGRWGGGDYSPKWVSTTYTLLHLLWLGLPPGNLAALAGCERLWEWQRTWRAPETCIASMLVRLTAAYRYEAEVLRSWLSISLINNSMTAAGTVRHVGSRVSTALSTPAFRRSRLSTPISKPGEKPTKRRRLEVGSSFCGIGCTSLIAQVRWRFVGARASLSCPSGILTCYADSSTSLTWPRTGTNGSTMP